ncbi:MAG: hypothetical protein OXC25_00540 [Thiotrichales bacterium]|nr:hypothetical protein [Thiotrichales bacterium]
MPTPTPTPTPTPVLAGRGAMPMWMSCAVLVVPRIRDITGAVTREYRDDYRSIPARADST